jgi:hypothetical protein
MRKRFLLALVPLALAIGVSQPADAVSPLCVGHTAMNISFCVPWTL